MSIHGENRTLTMTGLGTGLADIVHRAGITIQSLLMCFQRRNMVNQLLGLDDHMLRDMGLSRSDVVDAASEPIWRDPSRLLKVRAVERRTLERDPR